MKYLLALLWLLPTTALAASPVAGTNDYLKALGYTDAQLTTHVATEDREAFEAAEGPGRVDDPTGDVVSRWGETSAIHYAWGDVTNVTLTKNDEAQTWDFVLTLGGDVPATLADDQKSQWFAYLDADGDASNNAVDGIRAGTDAEFSVQYNHEHGWYTDFRWFNNETNFWATNKETAATFDISGNALTLHIPFAEAPATLSPHWRTALGITEGSAMQLDVVPGVGFPPPKGETYPAADSNRAQNGNIAQFLIWLVFFLIVGFGAKWVVAKKRQT